MFMFSNTPAHTSQVPRTLLLMGRNGSLISLPPTPLLSRFLALHRYFQHILQVCVKFVQVLLNEV